MIFSLPKINKDKNIYIYGRGLMGISYARQLKQQGYTEKIQGFIEENTSQKDYLDIPVFNLAQLNKKLLKESIILIASIKYKDIFYKNLKSLGCQDKNIILPTATKWKNKSLDIELEQKNNISVCIVSPVISEQRFNIIYKKSLRILKQRADIKIDIITSSKPVPPTGNEKIKIHNESSKDQTVLLVEKANIILLLNSEDIREIPINQHKKIYFYGLTTSTNFQKKISGLISRSWEISINEKLNNIQNKKIRTVFLVIHKSIWKLDSIFKKMLVDPDFEPIILVCPYTSYGNDRMIEEMTYSYDYFKNTKNYPTILSYNTKSNTWLSLEDLKPDLIFFTNPHNLTHENYYESAYTNYLSCYVPYHHETSKYGNNIPQYGRPFHDAQWIIFSSCKESVTTFEKTSKLKGKNIFLTGYPAMEELLDKIKNKHSLIDPWKNSDKRKRIIWAPHHSIDKGGALPYSSFLENADLMKSLCLKYKDKLTWCFKPHPLLKPKLYAHSEWGKEKTDLYYSFWNKEENSQIELGEYIDLFCTADAMIHDSSSFLAEFLYTKKPVLYTISKENDCYSHFSEFGKKAYHSCYHARTNKDIEKFIKKIIFNDEINLKKAHLDFLEQEIYPFFKNMLPSEKIIDKIKSSLVSIRATNENTDIISTK